jgi:hypothetical protein
MPKLEPIGRPGKPNRVVANDFTLSNAFDGKRIVSNPVGGRLWP